MLLREHIVLLRWITNTIVPDEDGGPDSSLSGFLPWILVVFYHTSDCAHMEYYFSFVVWTILVH